MSPSPELIVLTPHAVATTASSIPTGLWSAGGQHPGGTWESPIPPNTCHLLVEDLSLTPSASCIPLSYSLAIVQFVTVCFTPDHLLSHSHSPTSIKSLSPIAVSLSLVGCLLLSLVNSSFSQLSPLSAYSLDLSRVLSLHLDCCSSSCCLALSHYLPL